MLKFLKGQARNIQGLNTVPGLIALVLWACSPFVLWIDLTFPGFAGSAPFKLFHTDYETAKTVLSTIATASITTLGLVYSIVLVVFTTAAGNIGPRLLQRFTADSINQFTAGLFGGTFLFALTVLHQTDAGFVPSISIAVTFMLAGLSVLQLIYFVHHASVSVTIDEEVAAIARQMETDIASLLDGDDGLDDYSRKVPDKSQYVDNVDATTSGYVTHIHTKRLVDLAREHDTFIDLCEGNGSFLVPGMRLANVTCSLDGEERDALMDGIINAVTVSDSRSPDSDVEFSINLLVEIALRALSPGINDTFTAIACVDRISSALVRPVRTGLRDNIRSDENKVPRLHIPGLTLRDLLNGAFHPLRRAAFNNVLMTKHLLDALNRLCTIGSHEARNQLQMHADAVMEDINKTDLLKVDREFLQHYYEDVFAKQVRNETKSQ